MSLRQFISSRKILRSFNLVKESATLRWREDAAIFGLQDDVFENPRHRKLSRPVTVILVGAGHRGSIYADYAAKFPEELKIVGVAESNKERLAKTKLKF